MEDRRIRQSPWFEGALTGFLAIGGAFSAQAMQRFYRPNGDDPRVIAGASCAASAASPGGQIAMPTGRNVLLINTKGATDLTGFPRIAGMPVVGVEPS